MLDIRPTHYHLEHVRDHFQFLLDRCRGGARCALVTIVDFSGSSSRSRGAHMVVCDNGEFTGTVSSGCFDANVATVAIDALKKRHQVRVKFGDGSPYIDVKLPCGGGIELLIEPDPDLEVIEDVVSSLADRKKAVVTIGPSGFRLGDATLANVPTGWDSGEFVNHYDPQLRLIIAGRGQELIALTRIANATGFHVDVYSPDTEDLRICESLAANCHHLVSVGNSPDLVTDRWTACVLFFHDHDWEPALLRSALKSDAAYIGALGSRITQASRLDRLRHDGVDEEALKRIIGPIGLVPSMRNPSMLAISVLAEIIGNLGSSESQRKK